MASRPKRKRKWKTQLKLESLQKELETAKNQYVGTKNTYQREAVFPDVHN